MSNSSRNALRDFCLRPDFLLAFFPNAPPAPPRCGGRPPPGRCGPPVVGAPVPGVFDLYGELLGAPVRGAKPPAPPAPPGAPVRGAPGRAAKPGRTEPGREPAIPERGCPVGEPCGLCGGRGTAPPVENGLLPGRGGRGTAPPVENGLLPGRGAGFAGTAGDDGVVAVGADPPSLASFARSCASNFAASSRFATALACSSLSASISTPSSAANSAACSGDTSPFGFAAAFFAAAFLTGFFSSTGFASGYISIILRTTGASTVDDAERTNSPISWSFARTTLLSMPSCFANSCTRTFDTFLLSWPAFSQMQALVERPHSSNELI